MNETPEHNSSHSTFMANYVPPHEQMRLALIEEKDRISQEYLEMTQKRLMHYIMIRSSHHGYRDLDQLEHTILTLFRAPMS